LTTTPHGPSRWGWIALRSPKQSRSSRLRVSGADRPAGRRWEADDGWGSTVMQAERERAVVETLVGLADALAEDTDPLEMLSTVADRAARPLGASTGGFAVATDTGSCIDCVRSGEPVVSEDLADGTERWPRFVAGGLRRERERAGQGQDDPSGRGHPRGHGIGAAAVAPNAGSGADDRPLGRPPTRPPTQPDHTPVPDQARVEIAGSASTPR
jgi:hypothetical protein